MRICTVVGARPQFVKASVVSPALSELGIREDIVHTGQHYDDDLSRLFFEELKIPDARVNLGAGSGGHAAQTGLIMRRLENYLVGEERYDMLIVFGDTNSTLAAALVAAKLHVPLAHVEAGLRSFNRRMPEEINRVVTDRLAQLLFCPSPTAVRNLRSEGITSTVVHSGDVMLDALLRFRPAAMKKYPPRSLVPFDSGEYYLATIHRAENTDDVARLSRLTGLISGLDKPTVWPMHPRASRRIEEFDIEMPAGVHRIGPVGYLAMLALIDGSKAVLTDSGGIQKEALWLRKPCVTLRSETEWTETLERGWNTVADLDPTVVAAALSSTPQKDPGDPFGTGEASNIIAGEVKSWLARGVSKA